MERKDCQQPDTNLYHSEVVNIHHYLFLSTIVMQFLTFTVKVSGNCEMWKSSFLVQSLQLLPKASWRKQVREMKNGGSKSVTVGFHGQGEVYSFLSNHRYPPMKDGMILTIREAAKELEA